MLSSALSVDASLEGDVIRPNDANYASARRTRLVSGAPALVIVPADVHAVSLAVQFARDNGLEVAVRGGGHSFAGFGTTDTGIVIDLSRLTQVTVLDEERRLVRIGGGATWGQASDLLSPKGLAISSGDTRSVGVGGLTLSGGMGWKVRKRGLALDNLKAAEVVTSDGSVLRVSAHEHPDLFWAIRGGGGNFGIVTAFEFAAHATTEVFFGSISFPSVEARTVLAGWMDYLRRAPEELTSIANLANPRAGRGSAPVDIYVCWDGDDANGAAQALAPIRGLGTILADDVARRPYASVLEDGGTLPDGFRIDTRSGFVNERSASLVLNKLADLSSSESSPFISIRALGGAVRSVPDDGTAFAHRSAEFMVVTVAAGPLSAVEAGRSARSEMWRELQPYLCGAYANFLDSATPQDVRDVYPSHTYRRLASVKRRYDPSNLFRLNHNVAPADDRTEGTLA